MKYPLGLYYSPNWFFYIKMAENDPDFSAAKVKVVLDKNNNASVGCQNPKYLVRRNWLVSS